MYGRRFLIRTGHGALHWLLNFKNPEGQLARRLELLGTYDFDIQHRPGRQYGNADALSRKPCGICKYSERAEQKGWAVQRRRDYTGLRMRWNGGSGSWTERAHSLLLQKLQGLGVADDLWWIKDYPKNRTQETNKSSKWQKIRLEHSNVWCTTTLRARSYSSLANIIIHLICGRRRRRHKRLS